MITQKKTKLITSSITERMSLNQGVEYNNQERQVIELTFHNGQWSRVEAIDLKVARQLVAKLESILEEAESINGGN